MQINFKPEDMHLIVNALTQAFLRTEDPDMRARIPVLIGRFNREIGKDAEKRAKAYALVKRIKRERTYGKGS